jgi:cell division septum initiation protein DivIVA
MRSFGFPHDEVPTLLDLDEATSQDRVQALEQENQQLKQRVDALETQLEALNETVQTQSKSQANSAPGVGLVLAGLGVIAAALVTRD